MTEATPGRFSTLKATLLAALLLGQACSGAPPAVEVGNRAPDAAADTRQDQLAFTASGGSGVPRDPFTIDGGGIGASPVEPAGEADDLLDILRGY